MRRGICAGSAVAVLILTAGCGLSDGPAEKSDAVRPAGSGKQLGSLYGSGADAAYGNDAAAAPAGGAGTAGPAGELKVREAPNLGATVTDGQGFTLYRFDKDTPKPPASACEGDCAKVWPVVSADEVTAGAGIDAGLLGSVTRADGSKQLTLGGWPVYRYAKDTKAGDTLGEGVGGTWHALGPTGKPAAPAGSAGSGADPGAPDTGAYGDTANTGNGGNTGNSGNSGNSGNAAGLSTRKDPRLGTIVADGAGRTLYRFDKDSAWPMRIGCLDSCLDTWKPASPVDKAMVSGVAAELIGTVKRPDGSEQLTIDCWPVYSFTGDQRPGDTTGHGKQGLWFAVTDRGGKAKAS
ncbi:SCO0930 family lipoprotein [Streptomyces sp. NPDC048606]|uniref:SCO0930 family lipoprotein n=1 Tax=Streptomyces sp. NPDC048606 TaxID=3154726 RepID=UPI0034306DDB